MRTHAKQTTPLDILTELVVEGTSSLVEAQRTLLGLAKQENEILLGGIKERVTDYPAGVAMTDLVRRSLGTLLDMQQELLTATSKQTLHWLELEQTGKGERPARLMEMAKEAVEAFTRAQQKFLDAVAQESAKATSGKRERIEKKTEFALLAKDAANAFIEAQKRLLDVMGQQMNVNLDAATRTAELMSPERLVPVATLTGKEVRNFFDTERSLIGSLMNPRKPKGTAHAKNGKSHPRKDAATAV